MKNVIFDTSKSFSILILTLVAMFLAFGTAPALVNSKMDPDTMVMYTNYGTLDWSTAAQGHITFTATGQDRCFILQGPSCTQTFMTVQKGETIHVALMDEAGRYQYAIADLSTDGKTCAVRYKNSFTVGTAPTNNL